MAVRHQGTWQEGDKEQWAGLRCQDHRASFKLTQFQMSLRTSTRALIRSVER
jgi:hypothetical protein